MARVQLQGVLPVTLFVLVVLVLCAQASVLKREKLQQEARRELLRNGMDQAKRGISDEQSEALKQSKAAGKKHVMFVAFDYECDLFPMLSLAQALSEQYGEELTASLALGPKGMERIGNSASGSDILILPGGTDTLFSLDSFSWDELSGLGVGHADELGLSVPLSTSGRVLFETFLLLNAAGQLPDVMVIDQWCWGAMEAAHLFGVPYIVNIPHALSSTDSPFADELLPYSTPVMGRSLWIQPWVRWARMICTRLVAMASQGEDLAIRRKLYELDMDPELWKRTPFVFDDRIAGHVVLANSAYSVDLFPSDRPLQRELQLVGNLFWNNNSFLVEEMLFRSHRRAQQRTNDWTGEESHRERDDSRIRTLSRVEDFIGTGETLLVSLDNRLMSSASEGFFKNALGNVIKQSDYDKVIVSVFIPEQEETVTAALEDDERVLVVLQENVSYATLQRLPQVSAVLSTCSSQEILTAAAGGVKIVCAPFSSEQELAARKAAESGVVEVLSAQMVRRQLSMEGKTEKNNNEACLAEYFKIAGGASSAAEIIREYLFSSDKEAFLTRRNEDMLHAVTGAGYERGLPAAWQLQPIIGVVLPVTVFLLMWCRFIEPALRYPFQATGRGLVQETVSRGKKTQ